VLNKLFIEAEHEEITPEHIHLSMQDAHIEDIGQDDI
jgi:hypothetical protein